MWTLFWCWRQCMSAAAPYLALLTVSVFPRSDKDQPAPALILHKCGGHARPPPLKLAGCSLLTCRAFMALRAAGVQSNSPNKSWRGSYCQPDWSCQFKTLINVRLLPQKFNFLTSLCLDRRKEKPLRVLPLSVFLLIHMKLMLFTHFCKHISPIFIHLIGFPPWITDKKIYILEVMQTPATTAGSEQGCKISENDILSEISQNPPLRIPDKHHTAWAFEWKVIRCRACHGWQRRTTSTCNCCLLQRSVWQCLPIGRFTYEGNSHV